MPAKHQPDHAFLRHVPLRRIHLFTLVQMLCLAVLWILKSTVAAIIFPVMVRWAQASPSCSAGSAREGVHGETRPSLLHDGLTLSESQRQAQIKIQVVTPGQMELGGWWWNGDA